MSCLLGCGYFEEVGGFGAREYRNNAFSDILKRDHPSSMADAVGFVGDEGFRAASRLLDSAKIRKDENGQVVKSLPAVNLAFGFQEPIFEWMSKPEEAWRGQRLGKAMQQLHRMSNGNVGIDYPWSTLTSPIIDVGGGIGSLELALLEDQRNIHLKFVIFDIPNTTENAAKLWSTQSTSMLSRVSFMAGDFLAPIPSDTNIPKGQPTYVVRHVLHDWTDDEVVTILSNVRNAMATNSLLLICDMLLQANSSRFVRATSMQLLALNNGITRTEGDMIHLLEKAGFSVRKVHKMRAVDSIIEAVIT
ncbi:S-adenosyl-L-methionine-dependent methyltransferase [Gloeophyllum trabeum ATCC 11539]|uniref:S-adenosyl-L-methionine-dependent methyltransferase n=1 Tax=Gloeophyllum trabeum (strain ATCC 11539 / FP-39264 / Madison 617) TaxID=670483 RepID=S7S1X6_GLOTA|nr:S-adenosyl-L-methionine-dependent methyltransferase [Gloeophyllum trabeum ATCC 11539]EPQ59774.1 S-adenosyl-L-methionine-dependent methyltransferase [Gloeophyllum trabeum ATCC 11539]